MSSKRLLTTRQKSLHSAMQLLERTRGRKRTLEDQIESLASQHKLVKALSGGDRNRLPLENLLRSGGNVLLLDEPTNDLDVETLRALEEALLDFPGCVGVISHDRWFLDRIATHIIAFEDNAEVVFFEGNYTEYEADKVKRLGDAATQPHRMKYKKLTH